MLVSGIPCLQQASTGLSMWEGCPKSKAQCAATFQTLFASQLLLPHGQSKSRIRRGRNVRGIPEPKPSIWHISSRFTNASLPHCMLTPCPPSPLFHFCSALSFWLLFWQTWLSQSSSSSPAHCLSLLSLVCLDQHCSLAMVLTSLPSTHILPLSLTHP